MLLAPTLVSSSNSIRPSTVAAWAAQGPANLENICNVCVSFATAEEDSVGEFLREVSLEEDGGQVTSIMCVEMQGVQLAPHIVLIHGLGAKPLFNRN